MGKGFIVSSVHHQVYLSSLSIFMNSRLGNKLLQIIIISFHCAMRVLPFSGINIFLPKSTRVSFTSFKIYGCLNTHQQFVVPFRGITIVSQDHIRKWCQGRSRTGIETGAFVLVVRCNNHDTTTPHLSVESISYSSWDFVHEILYTDASWKTKGSW